MTWLLGLVGWGSAAVVVAALLLEWALSKKALLILGAVAGALLFAWGVRGYVQASALQVDLDTQIAATAKAEGERDTARGERDKARKERKEAQDAADTCSKSVDALEAAATKREQEGAPARKAAADQMHKARQRANAQLAAPPSVPGNDAASAQDRAWSWLKSRGNQ